MAGNTSDFYQYTTLAKRASDLREKKAELHDRILAVEDLLEHLKALSKHPVNAALIRANRICLVKALFKPHEYIVKHGSHKSLLSFEQLYKYTQNASKDFQSEYRRCQLEIDQIEQRLNVMDECGVKEIVQVNENSYIVKHDLLVEIVEMSPIPYRKATRTCRFKTAEELNAYLKSAQKKP